MIRFHFRLQSKISIKYGRDQKRPVNKHTLLKKLSKVFNVYRQIDFIYIYTVMCYDVDTMICILEHYFPIE